MSSNKFNRGTPWGSRKNKSPEAQSEKRDTMPAKALPYIHKRFLWFGNITQARIRQEKIQDYLIIGNYGGRDWETNLRSEVPCVEPVLTQRIVIPALQILRLPVIINPQQMGNFTGPSEHYIQNAIYVEGMDVYITVRFLFKWNLT